jgi:hypothetical protein
MGCYNALLVSTHCSHSAYTSLYMQIIRSIYVTILCLKRMFAIALPFYSKQASKHIHACSQFLYICTCYFLYSTHSSNVIYQLRTFLVVRKSRKNKSMSPELKKAFSFFFEIYFYSCLLYSSRLCCVIHSTERPHWIYNTLDRNNEHFG